MPPCVDFKPSPPEILFFNMKGEDEAKSQAYPVCPVYVHRLDPVTKMYEIYWYQWSWKTKYPPGVGSTGGKNKTVSYDRFMQEPEWRKKLGIKKGINITPCADQILPFWGANKDQVPATFFVPLRMCSGEAYKEQNVLASDKLTFCKKWWEEILVPELIKLDITNTPASGKKA